METNNQSKEEAHLNEVSHNDTKDGVEVTVKDDPINDFGSKKGVVVVTRKKSKVRKIEGNFE